MKKQRRVKRPVLPENLPTLKIPRYLGTPNLEERLLAWRFNNADIEGPFSCGDLTHSDFKLLWDRLRAFEKMNVAQFRAAQSFHKTPTPNLSNDAKRRLQEIQLDDVDVLYSFRVTAVCVVSIYGTT